MDKTTLPPLEIGLSDDAREKVVTLLSEVLADQHVIYIKTRNYHWNLIGGRFHSLHVHFEEMYTELATVIDETAERIRMIGGVSPGSMAEFLKLSSLAETEGDLVEGDAAIRALLKDHESAIQSLRKKIAKVDEQGDIGTEDFLTGLIQKHEMTAWMLRSYLETQS